MLIRHAEIGRHGLFDVRVEHGCIAAVSPQLDAGDDEILDAKGGCLLPGLHDHHIHVLALAAAERSIRCGPPHVHTEAELARALEAAAGASSRSDTTAAHGTAQPEIAASSSWMRGVGYHESVAGELNRTILDRWVSQRPLRVQHRSGAAWFLNSPAIRALGLDAGVDAKGVERDETGRATGRLVRCDGWLRTALGDAAVPDLADVSMRLARYGVTGITDATAANGPAEAEAFTTAVCRGQLVQALSLMGGDDLPDTTHPHVRRAARKILLDEAALPSLDDLIDTVRAAHSAGRPVAFHCVTRTELVLACAALRATGSSAADRLEHAAIVAPDSVALLREVGATVVTQPNFVFERGDEYLTDVEACERPWLYRLAGLLKAGVPVGAGTDAPYGNPDPWVAMRAAVSRTTRSGRTIAPEEAVTPECALRLFVSAPDAPGGAARPITIGSPADLCLLDRSWQDARERLRSDDVRATLRAGRYIWRRD